MSPDREHYLDGREHAAIKHFFLRHYLKILALKTLQAQLRLNPNKPPALTYIDGFTGPWEAKDENYADTSFGVAIEVLREVKAKIPSAQIQCVFCEARRSAFKQLEKFIAENVTDIETKCVHGRFEECIDEIVAFVNPDSFRFAFIDPKGWKVDVQAIKALLKEQWSEVLFTFMAEFIGRFPDFDKVASSYAALLEDDKWRERYDALPASLTNDERILLLFREVLKEKWGFKYVLEFPIKKAQRDRIFYKLVYGTRSPHGVFVFRDAQAKAEKEGFAVDSEARAREQEQASLFTPDQEADHIAEAVGVGSNKYLSQLPEKIKNELGAGHRKRCLELSAKIMEDLPVRETDVITALRKMVAEGILKSENAKIDRKSVIWLSNKP